MNSVRVDDWIVEWTIIASKVMKLINEGLDKCYRHFTFDDNISCQLRTAKNMELVYESDILFVLTELIILTIHSQKKICRELFSLHDKYWDF